MRCKLSLPGALLFWGTFALVGAHAQATIKDCEKIEAADAYNQCLAKFGPESKVKSVEPSKPSDYKENGEAAATSAGSRKASSGEGSAHRSRATRGHRSRKSYRGRKSHAKSRGSRKSQGKAHGGRKRMQFRVRKRRH